MATKKKRRLLTEAAVMPLMPKAQALEMKMVTKEDIYKAMDKAVTGHREGNANWIKCLVGIEDAESGRVLAREFHGGYSCIIEAMEAWEQAFGREAMLPIEDVTIENQCGYIFKGSTNQIKYIDEYGNKQGNCA